MAPGGAVFRLWRQWQKYGTFFRAGGWANQPAALLAQFEFMDLLESTWLYYRSKDAILAKLTLLQRDLITWLDDSDG